MFKKQTLIITLSALVLLTVIFASQVHADCGCFKGEFISVADGNPIERLINLLYRLIQLMINIFCRIIEAVGFNCNSGNK